MLELKPLTSENIPEITALILEKCTQSNLVLPDIPKQIPIKSSLTSILHEFFEDKSGYGLYRNKTLESFLLGYSGIPQLKGKDSGSYIPIWGHFIPKDDEQQFYRLYSALAQDMAKVGAYSQIISYFPSEIKLQEQLYTLGYGLLVIDAIRSMDTIPTKPLKSNFILRAMTNDDHKEMNRLSADFASYMRESPTFLVSIVTDSSPIDEFISESVQTFIIETQGKIVAAIRGVLGTSNFDLLKDPKTIAINYAYTNPEFRGFGLGTHLINAVLKWGKEHQMVRCTVDFESANLLANRFWLSHFSSICYSAIRKIDNRL